ncbi:flavodoxin family protein [Lacinutrix jangbogonensis]|uniref:flavodoxin family protein n=1 Tax=Lacinutrix jangbogonensis TaxID=1469557 RepID=UPI00053D509A|nr:NAD(P)H-dependent oxidoreductase [Lacinutrix jangbogonensis]
MKKGIIIQGSSRSEGDTSKIVTLLKADTGFDVVDLNQKNIGHFDYEFKNRDDDFIELFKDIVTNYNVIVFVTPIYWYTMSGIMKVFFDRISDFLKLEKDYGRQLRGMEMASVSSSNDSRFYDGFEMPFKNSAAYLGMTYRGHLHTWVENDVVSIEVKNNINAFFSK